MIIKEKLGNLSNYETDGHVIDRLQIEWYEAGKRILHKKTASGKEVIIKFLQDNSPLMHDDVVYKDEMCLIVIDIQACEVISIKPASMYQMACLCYEIGNKHLPLFYEADEVLVPFEAPLFRLLTSLDFAPKQENRKLLYPLKTTVAPHNHSGNSGSLFSKILQLTTPSANA